MKILDSKALGKLNRQLDREFQEGMAEIEKMLRELLVVCLDRAHRRLRREQIDLPRYYREVEAIACLADRLNHGAE